MRYLNVFEKHEFGKEYDWLAKENIIYLWALKFIKLCVISMIYSFKIC